MTPWADRKQVFYFIFDFEASIKTHKGSDTWPHLSCFFSPLQDCCFNLQSENRKVFWFCLLTSLGTHQPTSLIFMARGFEAERTSLWPMTDQISLEQFTATYGWAISQIHLAISIFCGMYYIKINHQWRTVVTVF